MESQQQQLSEQFLDPGLPPPLGLRSGSGGVTVTNNNQEEDLHPQLRDQIIEDGLYVVLQRGDGQLDRIIEYKSNETVKYGKGTSLQEIELKNANGFPFYSTFKVKVYPSSNTTRLKTPQGQLCYLEQVSRSDPSAGFTTAIDCSTSGKDNRELLDDNLSQPLGATDIACLREKGASGPEILDTLISRSKTFGKKTEFSQEKYLKKKEKLYGDTIVILRPTLSLVSDYYFKKDPSKILNMRPDALAQMICYANVHANGNYLVYETGCSGLLVAAVLQKLGGLGTLLHVHAGNTPQRQALFYLNFTQDQLKPLRSLDVFYLIRPIPSSSMDLELGSRSRPSTPSLPKICEDSDEPIPKKAKTLTREDDPQETPENNGVKESLRRKEEPIRKSTVGSVNRTENENSVTLLNTTKFDGFLVCAREHPLTIVQRLLPHLGSSAPFAIFCQHPEPLIECYTWIKDSNLGVNLNLVENWFRNIQIETERTHPEINMSSNGGYLLYGTSIKT